MTVISLTTIPSRFSQIGPTLETLVAQTADIDSVRLYIPRRYRRFPDYDGSLPEVPKGVEIRVCDEDLGPATKVLPCAQDFEGENHGILFCDDDRLYAPDWAEAMLRVAAAHPDHAICTIGWQLQKWDILRRGAGAQPRAVLLRGGRDRQYRIARFKQQLAARTLRPVHPKPPQRPVAQSGHVDIFGGYGGVFVRSDWFGAQAREIPDTHWLVDDIWLSGMLAVAGIPIWAEAGLYLAPADTADRVDALFRSVIEGRNREELNRRCIEYIRTEFGVWE